ncbi:DEAD/DEAH box helicase [Shewanella sp. JL219SE-S6]
MRRAFAAACSLEKSPDSEAKQQKLAELSEAALQAYERAQQRLADRPVIEYPDELPVSQKRDEIASAIINHQVVIVAGETGSGKTTQLPKICLDLGLGSRGLIGHTQPRRLAARSVASRVADELKTELGQAVGFKVRFADAVSQDSYIKLMTDGILLAELASDKWLSQYDCLIIDEAHERSLNIDFILGYLKQILQKRPDLKLIITSATIDVERFSKHFDNAPVVEVSGRTYPVETRYRPCCRMTTPTWI